MLQKENRSLRERMAIQITEIASRPYVTSIWYFFVVLFFIVMILLPTIFVLGYVLIEFPIIQETVFSNNAI